MTWNDIKEITPEKFHCNWLCIVNMLIAFNPGVLLSIINTTIIPNQCWKNKSFFDISDRISVELTPDGSKSSFYDEARNTSLLLDTKLKLKTNINKCIKKAYLSSQSVYSFRYFLPLIVTKICNTLIMSHFNFTDAVYGTCLDTIDIGRIQKIRN